MLTFFHSEHLNDGVGEILVSFGREICISYFARIMKSRFATDLYWIFTLAIAALSMAGCAGDDKSISSPSSVNELKPLENAFCMQSESDSLLGELSGDFNQNEIEDTFRLFYDHATGDSRLVLCELNHSKHDSIVFLLDLGSFVTFVGSDVAGYQENFLLEKDSGKVVIVDEGNWRQGNYYQSWTLQWHEEGSQFRIVESESSRSGYEMIWGERYFESSLKRVDAVERRAYLKGFEDCICPDAETFEWEFWRENVNVDYSIGQSSALPEEFDSFWFKRPEQECPPVSGIMELPYGDTLIQNLKTVFFENESRIDWNEPVVVELKEINGPSQVSAMISKIENTEILELAFDFGSNKNAHVYPLEIKKSDLMAEIFPEMEVSDEYWETREQSSCALGRNYIQIGTYDFNSDGVDEVVLAYGTNAGDGNIGLGDLMLIKVFAIQDPLWGYGADCYQQPVFELLSFATNTNHTNEGTKVLDGRLYAGDRYVEGERWGFPLGYHWGTNEEQCQGQQYWTAQSLAIPYGVVYPTIEGLYLKSEEGLKRLTYNSKDFSPAYVCGGDAEIYFLRGTDYISGYDDYSSDVTKLMRLDLTTGFEEQILLSPEYENQPEVGSLTHGDLSRAKSIDKDFRGYPDENDLIEVKGSHFSRLDAGCTYPYLFFEIPGYHQWDFVYKYDTRNGSFQVINYVLGFEVIKSGEYKGLLLGNKSFIREGLGRVWGDILFNENGETLKELSEADASGSRGASYRQRGMSILNCSTCDYQERDGRRDVSRIDASLAEGLMSTGIEFRESPQKSEISSIAVIPRPGIDCEGQAVSSDGIVPSVEGALLEVYKVVDRGNLDELLAEQKLSLSGLVQSELIEAGNTAGAEGFLFCEVGCFGGESTIDLRLVDAETSAVQWTCTGRGVSLQGFLTQLTEKLNTGDNPNKPDLESRENTQGSSEAIPTIPEEEIRSIISEYYEFVMKSKWRKLEGLYANRLSRFFDNHDVPSDYAIERAKSYDDAVGVVSKRHEIRWGTLQTSSVGSNTKVNFTLDYFLRRKNQPNERHYVLKITMLLDENGKIAGVWE